VVLRASAYVSEKYAVSIFRAEVSMQRSRTFISHLIPYHVTSVLKMKTSCFLESFVSTYKITRRQNPWLHQHDKNHRENLKYHLDFSYILYNCPDQIWGPPSLLPKRYRGPFPGVKRGRGVTLTAHIHLVPEVNNEYVLYVQSLQAPPWHVVGWLYLTLLKLLIYWNT
jgi:hypothetical protein